MGLFMYVLEEIDLYYILIFVFLIDNTTNSVFKVIQEYFDNRKVLVKAP